MWSLVWPCVHKDDVHCFSKDILILPRNERSIKAPFQILPASNNYIKALLVPDPILKGKGDFELDAYFVDTNTRLLRHRRANAALLRVSILKEP